MDYTNDREALLSLLRTNLSDEKYAHTLSVETTAINLAKAYGEDVKKAAFASLLHDITKCLDNVSLAKEYGIENYVSVKTLHAYTGSIYIQKQGITDDPDIINAVKYHTTGRGAMSMLEKIVYLADLIEPGRNYAEAEKIKPVCFKSLDKAMFLSLKMTIQLIIKRNSPIDLNTVSAYNYYSKIKSNPKNKSQSEEYEWKFPKKQNK